MIEIDAREDVSVISNQVLQSTVDGLKAISRVDLCVMDTEGRVLSGIGAEFCGITGGQPGDFRI